MPTTRKPKDLKEPKQRPSAAEKIRQGKVELSDEELTKVSAGQASHKQFTNIDP